MWRLHLKGRAGRLFYSYDDAQIVANNLNSNFSACGLVFKAEVKLDHGFDSFFNKISIISDEINRRELSINDAIKIIEGYVMAMEDSGLLTGDEGYDVMNDFKKEISESF